MKKFLIAALVVLTLAAVCVVGMIPALNQSTDSVTVGQYDAITGASIKESDITTTVTTPPTGAVKLTSWAQLTDMAGTYYLSGNITATGKITGPFTGKLYGNGYTITTATPLFETVTGAALYDFIVAPAEGGFTGAAGVAVTANGGTFTNLTNRTPLSNGIGTDMGGIVAKVVSGTNTFSYCVNEADLLRDTITSYPGTGGIAGAMKSANTTVTFDHCLNKGDIVHGTYTKTTDNGQNRVGGILGIASENTVVTIEDCVNTGKIDTQSPDGGMVGYLYRATATIRNCYNSGVVIGSTYAGGIVGVYDQNNNSKYMLSIKNCTNDADLIKTAGGDVGGIMGSTILTGHVIKLENCVNNGDATSNHMAAGMIAYAHAVEFLNCKNTGTIESKTSKAGGFVGEIGCSASVSGHAKLVGCENSGTIKATCTTGDGKDAGGFLGGTYYASGSLKPKGVYMKDCVNTGTIDATRAAGGMMANPSSSDSSFTASNGTTYAFVFENCENKGTVSGATVAGAIASTTNGAAFVKDCKNSAEITCTKQKIGTKDSDEQDTKYDGRAGFFGNVYGASMEVVGCENTGKMHASKWVGGLAGNMSTAIQHVDGFVNRGVILSNARQAGGLVGMIEGTPTSLLYENCHNYGTVTYTGGGAGGMVGEPRRNGLVLRNCINHEGATITGAFAGGIVGNFDTNTPGDNAKITFEGCENHASVTGNNQLGGILGRTADEDIEVSMSDCLNTGDVTNTGYSSGGMQGRGYYKGTYINCVNTGDITGPDSVGGITGYVGDKEYVTVTDCINTGDISGGNRIGGITGYAQRKSDFTNCVNTGRVYNAKICAGGIVGDLGRSANNGPVINACVSLGEVHCLGNDKDKSASTGGVVGYNGGNITVTNCVVMCNVTAEYHLGTNNPKQQVGALVGYSNATGSTFNNNYFTGTLTAGDGVAIFYKSRVGGLAGISATNNYTVNSYPAVYEMTGTNVWELTGTVPTTTLVAVKDGSLCVQLNTTATETSYFVQFVSCDGLETFPVHINALENTILAYQLANNVSHSYTQAYDTETHWDQCKCGHIINEVEHDLEWKSNGTEHWQECTGCDYSTTKVVHDNWKIGHNGEQHWDYCDTCGYETAKVDHATEAPMQKDVNNHWKICDYCETVYDVVAHDPAATVSSNAEYHWYICTACQYECNKVKHATDDPNAWGRDADTHYNICDVCETHFNFNDHVLKDGGEQDAQYHWGTCEVCLYETPHIVHVPTGEVKSDETGHWIVCAGCSYKCAFMPHSEATEWTTDGTNHWYACPDCGYKVAGTEAPHTFNIPNYNETHHWNECACGRADAPVAHTMDIGGDIDGHWTMCTGCAYVTEIQDHTPGLLAADGGGHYTLCTVCEHYVSWEAHRMVDLIDETYHGTICEVCEYIDRSTYGEHEIGIYVDPYYHYIACYCGLILDQQPHVFDRTVYVDGDYHTLQCACGITGSMIPHTPRGDWEIDDTHHYRFCACGTVAEAYEHETSDVVTCTESAYCDTCGAEMSGVGANNHTGTVDWDHTKAWVTTDEHKHYSFYSCCGAPVEGDHEWGNDTVCDVCGYECQHLPLAPATCTERATCAECGHKYGEVDLTNHNGVAPTKFIPSTTNPGKHDAYYGNCCEQTVADFGDHTGGTADCVNKAICDVCGGAYGELLTTHVFADAWSFDDTTDKHYHACTVVGCTVRGDEAACSGGEATCLQQAACSVCGNKYGEKDATNHEAAPYSITSTGDMSTHSAYYHNCCKATVNEAHIGGTASCVALAVCTLCDQEYGQYAACVWSAEWSYVTEGGVQYHYHACTVEGCEKINDKAACAGGTATCVAEAVCAVCEAAYGEKNPANHAKDTFTYNINAEDSEKHDKKHECCGVLVETVAHTFGEDSNCDLCNYVCTSHVEGTAATCQQEAICSRCGQEYGDVAQHAKAADATLKQDLEGDTHYYDCKYGCNTRLEETDCSGNESDNTCIALAKCATCGQEYGTLKQHVADTEKGIQFDVEKNTHYYFCTQVGCTARVEETACSGGTATCTDRATCSVCGNKYGEKDAENHNGVAPTKYTVNATDATKHDAYFGNCCKATVENYGAHTGGTADCVNKALCDLCGAAYGEPSTTHVFDTENWSFDETTNKHYHACTVVGCTARGDEAACSGGEATCVTKATCEVCAHKYGEKDATNHEAAPYTITSTGDNATHEVYYRDCCNETVAEAHTGGTADCMNKAVCTLCDQAYGEVDTTNHVTGCTINYTTKTETTHAGAYVTCGTTVAAAEHEFVDGVCTVCDYACTHKYSVATCMVKATCEYCQMTTGEVDTTNHVDGCEISYTTKTETTHAGAYTTCGTPVAAVNHAFTNGVCTVCEHVCEHNYSVANCTTKATCEYCGMTTGEVDPANHATGCVINYSTKTETTHAGAYSACGAPVAAAEHTFVDGVCTVCEHACTHKYSVATCTVKATCEYCLMTTGEVDTTNHAQGCVAAYTNNNNATHSGAYTACSTAIAAEAHTYVNGTCSVCAHVCTHDYSDATCEALATCEHCGLTTGSYADCVPSDDWRYDAENHQHQKYCTVCDELLGEPEDCDYEYKLNADESKHYQQCTVCNGKTAEVDHTMTPNRDNTDHWTECVCGKATDKVGHTLGDWQKDDTDHWKACACGYTTDKTPHTMGWAQNAEKHWQACECGQKDAESEEEHTFADGICSDCTYACEHDGETELVDNTESGQHDTKCKICGATVSSAAHEYNTWATDTDNTKHFRACACGKVDPADTEGTLHTEGTAANCNSGAICAGCGLAYGDPDDAVHASQDTEIRAIPGNLKQHQKVYTCCGAEIEKLDHTYEDGECTACEYVCTHEGGTATCKDKATCTACGEQYGELSTTHKYDNACDAKCNVCDAEREVAAHNWSAWTTTKEATATEKGSKKRICSVCNTEDVAEIAMLTDANSEGNKDDADKESNKKTVTIVVIVAACVLVGAACTVICVVVSKKKKAKAAGSDKPWRTTKKKKDKWKKKK